jgi:hypothetical protein
MEIVAGIVVMRLLWQARIGVQALEQHLAHAIGSGVTSKRR